MSDMDGTVDQVVEPGDGDPFEAIAAAEAGDEAAFTGTTPQGQPADQQTDQPAPGGEPAPDDQLIAGRFRTQEELVRSWEEAQAHQARQGTEIGQLRRQLDEVQSFLSSQAPPVQPGYPQSGFGVTPAGQPQLGYPQQQQPVYDESVVMQQLFPGVTPERFEEIALERPAQAAQMAAAVQTAIMREQMRQEQLAEWGPIVAQVAESQYQADAARSIERIKAEYGDETISRHSAQIAQHLQDEADYFVDPDTRHDRLRAYVALLVRQEGANGGGSAQPRDAAGRYASPSAAHHTEPGSTGHAGVAGGSPNGNGNARSDTGDPDVDGWHNHQETRDAFGRKPLAAAQVARLNG